MKRIGYIGLALLLGSLFPLAIWVAAGSAFYQGRKRAAKTIKGLPHWACSIDSDCPPGFVCVDGYCVPAKS